MRSREASEKPEAKKPAKKDAPKKAEPVAKNGVLAGSIDLSAIMTEKSMRMQGGNKVVVRVLPSASKHVIAKAVEQLFGVKVLSVTTLISHPKIRRRGITSGLTPKVKKAYVTVDDISKLNVAP